MPASSSSAVSQKTLREFRTGGQTGVDLGSAEAAIKSNFRYGGFVHRLRINERGPIERRYSAFVAMKVGGYPARTKKNVETSDATLVLVTGKVEGGTKLTVEHANACAKPCLVVNLDAQDEDTAVQMIVQWIAEQKIAILNVAGPRESTYSGIQARAEAMLTKLIALARSDEQ